MAWLGLIAGVVIGGLIWDWNGAVVLGFFGWLAGIIIGASKKPKTASAVNMPAAAAPKPVESPANRIDRLERTVAALESRLSRLESGVAPITSIRPAAAEGEPMIAMADMPEAAPAAVEPVAEPVAAPAPEPVAAPAELKPAPPLRPPAPPSPPNPIVAWFTGGNAIVRIGVVILFLGLVFLLNWAREHQLIPAEVRVAGVAIVGIVLLVFGWRLRKSREGYAVSLQGAGVAVLYLTVFASMWLYGLISPGAAFVLLAAIAIFSGVMALAQDSLALAIFGASGGFLAPILASTGSGNHVALFSYYLILTLGVVLIAWFKAWRSLNVLAFVFTVLVAFAWSERYYRDELFWSCELFLVIFFVLYIAIAILFARSQVKGTGRFVDGTLVFGNPLVAMTLQAGMLHNTEFALAYSSLAAAFIYLALAYILHRLRSDRWALLAQSFLALGVVFATLAIPLALDARWTSASWALEGAAIVWIGVRQRHTIARAFGLLLQFGAGVSYVIGYSSTKADVPFLDTPFIGAALLAGAGLWTHRLLARNPDVVTRFEARLVSVAFLWGLVWLLFAGHHEIEEWIPLRARGNAHVLFFAATALAFAGAGRRRDWRQARWPGLALIPVLWISGLFCFLDQPHAFANYGWLTWPLALAMALWIHRLFDAEEPAPRSGHHAGLFLLAGALGAWEMHWWVVQETARQTAWSVTSVLLIPAVLVFLASSRASDTRWPVAAHTAAYRIGGVFTTLLAMGFWILYANATHDGRSDPLPYLPLLNAIDLGHGLVFACVAAAALAWRRSNLPVPQPFDGRGGWVALSVLAFIWLNAILLRSIHHWADVPYRMDSMMRSVVVQASLSIFWTVMALALMMYAARTSWRALWMVGAALMGVVVVKLFLIDLSHIAGIERIVSFIAVGILMLVIGYFSPAPPRKREETP